MRKFKRVPPHGLRFRSLLILAGALMLMAAFVPRANADLIAYYNFEGTPTGGFPVNADSHAPAFFDGSDAEHTSTLITTGPLHTLAAGDLPLNEIGGGIAGLGLDRSGQNPGTLDMPLFSSQGFFSNMTVSFAINSDGNGYTAASFSFSTDGGMTFSVPNQTTTILTGPGQVITFTVPPAANNQNLLVLRISFTGGQSNGTNVQNIVDNIQVNGTIVPEPATVAGGLLGVLGLCWHQRRRLIRSVRFQRT